MLPKVSLIVPIFNKEKYLRKCLDILLSQTLQDIEIICVDDCSSDASRAILYEYAMKDRRIICIFHEVNKSTSQTRKDGVSVSTGKYIMFVDGDDELYPNSCEKAYNAIEAFQTDIVHFDVDIENCAKVPQARIDSNKKQMKPFMGRLEAEENLINLCWKDKKFGFQLWNKIYKGDIVRKAFSEVEDGSFPKAQDLYAFFLIAFYSKSYCGVADTLYKYNFGLGVTGRDFIPLINFRTLLTEKRVHEALTRFLEGKNQKEKYNEILNSIYNGFLGECVTRWRENLIYSEKSEGFELLKEVFGLEDVLCLLAKTDWNPEVRIGELIKDIAFFHHKKRDKKKKTIAAYYRSVVNGGAQRVVAMLCNRWAEMKDENGEPLYNVILVTDVEPMANEYDLSENVQRAFVPATASSVKENYRERYRAWANIIQDYDIDTVIYSLWTNPVSYWDMLSIKGQKTKPAFIIHAHNFCAVPFEYEVNTATAQIYKYMTCDGVVTLSECDKLFVSSFNKHVEYIVNPIAFNPKEIPISTYNDNTIVWVGRISQEKQPLDAIKMMKFVVDRIPDARLLIIGDGSQNLKRQMKELIEKYSLESNVKMEGFTLDVGKYYGMASVMVCTSRYEGFPLTLGEAMAFGVPVISYDMPWLSFMQDGRGIITVHQKRYELLADEVVRLLKNKEKIKKLGFSGKQQITEIAEQNIGCAWENFLGNIQEKSEEIENPNNTAIVFKYLTLFQYEGKRKAVDAEIAKGKQLLEMVNKQNMEVENLEQLVEKLNKDTMEKSFIKVSVIIPVYNSEKYLEQCLDSLINQTLTNIEIICVDDGSTDQSLNILEKYALKDSRILIKRQPNKGAGVARNLGLKFARGEYLSFLDSDDFFEKDMLNKMAKTLDTEKSDICICAAREFNHTTKAFRELPWGLVLSHCPKNSPFSPRQMEKHIFTSFQNWTWNKMFRHSFIKEKNLVYQNVQRSNDVAFVSVALALADKISIINSTFVNYRVGTGSSLQQSCDDNPLAFLEAYKETKRRLIAAGVYNEYEQSFLNKALDVLLYYFKKVKTDTARNTMLNFIKQGSEKEFGFLKKPLSYYENHKSFLLYCELTSHLPFIAEQLLSENQKSVSANKKINNELKNVKSGYSFRIGRIITWLPRKLTGRK